MPRSISKLICELRVLSRRWCDRKGSCGDNNARYVIAPGVKTAAHETGFALLHIGTGGVHLCNGSVAALWRNVIAGYSFSEMARNISLDFSISEQRAREDVQTFIEDLLRRRLILREKPVRRRVGPAWLVAKALWKLTVYDLKVLLSGFRSIHRALERQNFAAPVSPPTQRKIIEHVTHAVALASTLYWRPVQCLHRSVVLARMLRALGIPAQLVIGYRLSPFFSHAWVEVNGRVVNDSLVLPQHLMVLHRV